jgi:prophage regulatory protein
MANIIQFPVDHSQVDNTPTQKPRAVNKHEVLFALGISSPTLYRLIQKGLFPKPIKIGSKASRWLESDIQEYLDKVSAERNAA